MRVVDPGWASRFYGMDVSPAVAAAVREHLTDTQSEDLVDAHLGINYGYFGAIDKTLSGFVVLGDEGDNYTLLDLRDGQQIWWQDHETREVVLKLDGLDDLVRVRAALEADGADRQAIADADSPEAAKTTRRVSSAALLGRYQWLVWLLAQPLLDHGAPIQSADKLVRAGMSRFRYTWPRREQHDEAFEAEVGGESRSRNRRRSRSRNRRRSRSVRPRSGDRVRAAARDGIRIRNSKINPKLPPRLARGGALWAGAFERSASASSCATCELRVSVRRDPTRAQVTRAAAVHSDAGVLPNDLVRT